MAESDCCDEEIHGDTGTRGDELGVGPPPDPILPLNRHSADKIHGDAGTRGDEIGVVPSTEPTQDINHLEVIGGTEEHPEIHEMAHGDEHPDWIAVDT